MRFHIVIGSVDSAVCFDTNFDALRAHARSLGQSCKTPTFGAIGAIAVSHRAIAFPAAAKEEKP